MSKTELEQTIEEKKAELEDVESELSELELRLEEGDYDEDD